MLATIASAALRPVSHDARMTAVDHLEELRARLIISGAAGKSSARFAGTTGSLICSGGYMAKYFLGET